MKPRSIALFMICLSLMGLALCGCDDAKSKGTPASTQRATSQPAGEPISVRVAPVSRGSIDRTVEVVGTLYGEEEAAISAKVTGRAIEVGTDLGDRVKPGTMLVQLDPTDYRFALEQRTLSLREALAKLGLNKLPEGEFNPADVATVQKAAAQTENLKTRLDRATQLFKESPPLISEQDFNDLQTEYRVAQRDYDVAVLDARSTLASAASLEAAVRIAQQALDATTIRAPQPSSASTQLQWAIAERHVSIGELVQAGTEVFKVIADHRVKFRASVPEQFAGEIVKDQRVSLRIDALDKSVDGTVSRVSPAVDAASRTFVVEAIFDNPTLSLRPGSFGRATIIVGKRDNVTFIPPAALYSFAGLDKVFTVVDGKAKSNDVVVLERSKDRIVIDGNLSGSPDAIVTSLARLANQVPVVVDRK